MRLIGHTANASYNGMEWVGKALTPEQTAIR